AIAPWRASGKVTAPVSSLIIPKTYGVPVAFFAVPNTELPPAAAAVPPDVAVPEPAELLEPLELQPAATRPVTARATALSQMGCLIFASFVMVESFDQAWGSGPVRRPSPRGSWRRAVPAARGARQRDPRARSGRASGRRRDRRPPAPARRAAPRTARSSPARRPPGVGPGSAAPRPPGPAPC